MNDEFITRAIENDRYLKAVRLIDRFETEVEGELWRVTEEFIGGTRHLFDDNPEQDFDKDRNAESVIAHARVYTQMKRGRSTDSGTETQWLNITLRWLDPAKYGYSDIDGALCVTGYKINGAGSNDHNRIKRQTREGDWDVQFCRDVYENAPGMVYVPVDSATEIRAGFETLKQHFWEFGDEYGDEQDTSS